MTNSFDFQRSSIDAGGAVSNGWELVKSNYGMYLGISLAAIVLGGCIPCISLFLQGPIIGGVYYVILRQMRGEPVEFGMMFKGFDKFVPLMIIGQVLRIGVQVGNIGLNGQRRSGNYEFMNYASDSTAILASGVMIVIAIVAIVVILFAVVWRVLLFFAIPLAMERDIAWMDAIKLSAKAAMGNIGGLIVLFIFEFLVALLGLVMCLVGMFLVAIPIIYAANAFAYRQVFPWIEDQFNMSPPPPQAYGSNFGSGMD